MARCPACSGLIREQSALRCPFCGVSLTAGETRTAAKILTRHASSLQDPLVSALTAIGDARFAPGHVFAGRFRIVSLLGRGAMGEVYRAEDLRLGQPVALKLLTDLGPMRREALARFTTEVRLARTIAHPNVCRVFDIGEAEDWRSPMDAFRRPTSLLPLRLVAHSLPSWPSRRSAWSSPAWR